ncbi:MAG: hypothetical protein M3063_01675 [Actinomycetota bacterium]|nr:hypothetical protein [Actinomycetota bacterium]
MLERLGQALETADVAAAVATMTDDVTLRVAVHDQAFHGLSAATQILSAVLDGALQEIEVVETIKGIDASVLMFRARVADHPGQADGLLVVRSEGGSRISDLTVFLRPLDALQALADEMGRRLGGPRPDGQA